MKSIMSMIMKGSNSITINGETFSGNNVQITEDKIIIDGEVQGEVSGCKKVSVIVNGDVEYLTTGSGDVSANNVGEISTGSGDVECGYVSGNIRTGSGDVTHK